MYNIIRIDENKNSKSETLTAHLNNEDEVKKFLNEKFKIYQEAVFQTYLRLREDIQTKINETLTIIETHRSISVEHKIEKQPILGYYTLQEENSIKSKYTHYVNGMEYSTTYEIVKKTKD